MWRYSRDVRGRVYARAGRDEPPPIGADVADTAQSERVLSLPRPWQAHFIAPCFEKCTGGMVIGYSLGLLGKRNGTGPLAGRINEGRASGGSGVVWASGIE